MSTAIVNKIIRFSSVDGPGNRTVIFLQGCNLNCRYCHNPETIGVCRQCGSCVAYCKTGALSLQEGKVSYQQELCVNCDACFHHCPYGSCPKTKEMSANEVMEQIRLNKPYIRGITVSGGECTLWRDFLIELFTLAKKENLSTMLDSNGTYDFTTDEQLIAITDSVMLDVKAYKKEDHQRVTGKDNEIILKNLAYLSRVNKLYEVRTVVVPSLFDVEGTLQSTSAVLRMNQAQNQVRYKIIKYRQIGVRKEFKNLTTPTDEYMESLRDIVLNNGIKDIVII